MATRPQDPPTASRSWAKPAEKTIPQKAEEALSKAKEKTEDVLAKAKDKTEDLLGKAKEQEARLSKQPTVSLGGLKKDTTRHSHTHLIALDGSTNSQAAFIWANKNLPKQDRFILYSAIRKVPYVEGPLEGVDLDARERLLEKAHKERAQTFDRFKQACAASQRECLIASPEDEYSSSTTLGREICGTARDMHAKTVVCGSRGLSGISSYMMGSVSSKIVNSCDCSVVVVKDHDKAK